MFNVCPDCGEYSVAKVIEPAGPFAVCPFCDHRHPFLRLPLFLVTGASGAGKTAVCLRLVSHLPECVVLESDILWRAEFASPGDNYVAYREMWLRVAKNVGQAGRPVVLGGSAEPAQFAPCPERRYFADLHFLALVCDDDVLKERLRARPAWREAGGPEFVARMVQYNRWFQGHAALTDPPMTLLDTSAIGAEEATARVAIWIRTRLTSAVGP